VREAIQTANEVVMQYARKKPEKAADAGATLTMALVKGRLALIANVGDSRTYLLRKGTFQQVSHDHSLVANLVLAGTIKAEDIYTHPQRNIIYRSLGQKEKVEVDIFQEILEDGDILFLCSDGLWEMVRDVEIKKIITTAPDLAKACELLVDAANAAGGEDNISVVLARFDD
jgi:PPM family protein phosphatase